MNIVFADKLTAACWANVRNRSEANAEALDNWLCRFLNGAWGEHNDTTAWEVDPETEYRRAKPMWDRQSGRIGRLTIHASNWGMEMSPDGPVTSEFDWVVQTAPVDRYGTVPDEGAQWDLVMNGGLVNHGALDKPDWSSHT